MRQAPLHQTRSRRDHRVSWQVKKYFIYRAKLQGCLGTTQAEAGLHCNFQRSSGCETSYQCSWNDDTWEAPMVNHHSAQSNSVRRYRTCSRWLPELPQRGHIHQSAEGPAINSVFLSSLLYREAVRFMACGASACIWSQEHMLLLAPNTNLPFSFIQCMQLIGSNGWWEYPLPCRHLLQVLSLRWPGHHCISFWKRRPRASLLLPFTNSRTTKLCTLALSTVKSLQFSPPYYVPEHPHICQSISSPPPRPSSVFSDMAKTFLSAPWNTGRLGIAVPEEERLFPARHS